MRLSRLPWRFKVSRSTFSDLFPPLACRSIDFERVVFCAALSIATPIPD
jgi:hypothetical protein